jgi:hypothetical protein
MKSQPRNQPNRNVRHATALDFRRWRSQFRRAAESTLPRARNAAPRLENEKFFMTIGSSRPMEDAARRVRLGNMVDPKYTLGASILKSYLT